MKLRRELSKFKRKFLAKHLWFARFLLVSMIILILWGMVAGVRSLAHRTPIGDYFQMARVFLFAPDETIRSFDGRVNLLLLGLSGDGVKNPILSDTMILVSIGKNDTADVKMISIPRDIWVQEFSDKINSAYHHGNQKLPGGGLLLAKSSVEEVIGMPISHAIAIDFDGFVEIIDIVGGVEVDVEKSFIDERYPIAGLEDDECGGDVEYLCRYETITFEQGIQKMDGETALKFARSRHSQDPEEGNDLARARRQQKVLLALKQKLFSNDVLSSPEKLTQLWEKFWEITETGMTKQQMAYAARLMYDARDNISSFVIPEEYLYSPAYSQEYNNLFVFIPKSGNWDEVHAWVAEIFK